MRKLTLVAVLLLQAALLPASYAADEVSAEPGRRWEWPWAGEGCLPAGAARCDPSGRHLSVCLGPAGWRTAVDCARYGQRCTDGRCWPQGQPRTAESEPRLGGICGPGDHAAYRCSEDCVSLGICLDEGNWMELEACGDGSECYKGECQEASGSCPLSEDVQCVEPGLYPDLKDCAKYYECSKPCDDGECSGIMHGRHRRCADGSRFNPCSGTCDMYLDGACEDIGSNCTFGALTAARGNPNIYYVCLEEEARLWRNCKDGKFNGNSGKCEGAQAACINNRK